MSDIAAILKRRKFGEDNIIDKSDDIKPIMYPIVEESLSINNQTDQQLSLYTAKEQILSTNELDSLINNIKYFDSQATLSFFYLSHCFYKIREDRLYEQKGYANFTDFIDKELANYSMRQVYNYLNMAETFDINTPTNILELGSTKLSEIANIKEKSKRLKYVNENLEEIKKMSTRELRLRIAEMNRSKVLDVDKEKYYIEQWKNLTNKFNLFLEDINIDNIDNDKINVMKSKLNEIEEKIKDMQFRLDRKFAIDCKNDEININV